MLLRVPKLQPVCGLIGYAAQRGGRATAVALVALVLTLPSPARADGRFEVIDASARLDEGQWLVDARFELQLSSDAIEALENGVTLSIQVQYELNRRRLFWPDGQVRAVGQNFELQYLSLSERYVVNDPISGQQTSYATLFSALRSISQTRDFPLIAAADLETEADYRASVRVVLDRAKLPWPLQMLAFWRGDFSLESDWFTWTLR